MVTRTARARLCACVISITCYMLCAGGAVCAATNTYTATVTALADGDSGELLAGGRRFGFRLQQIDAPELDQPFGRDARRALNALVFGRQVRVVEVSTDSYGRAISRLYLDGLDVNAEMVRRGLAWVYTRYATDETLKILQRQARDARLGLWALSAAGRVPPWEWRQRKPHATRAVERPPAQAADCGSKRYCRQMDSCAEARFYLATCRVETIDGDGDGVPCEALCSESP